jgi:cyclic beta-1,2-glucan synthetase
VGVHGLPLMGTGDWNDGMNRVGHGGRGESVWLAWFLCRVVADFGPLARAARRHRTRAALGRPPPAGAALQGPAGTATGTPAPFSTTASRWARTTTAKRAST